MMRRRFLLLALVSLSWAAKVSAASDDEIARAVRDLGAADFKTREAASQTLWAAGDAAQPALERASRSPDPEVTTRTRKLLAKIRRGITPQTPAAVVSLLERYDTSDLDAKRDVVDRLTKLGEATRPILERLALEQSDLAVRMQVFQSVLGPLTEGLEEGLSTNEPTDEQVGAVLAQFCAWNSIFPEDPAPALTVVPWLDRVGRRPAADETFAAAWTRLETVIRRRPENAEAHNNLAWLGARLHRRLEDALAAAQRAARLAPNQAAYLDTLAEVQFQRGHRDLALAAIKKAIAQEPHLPYYRAQLARFEKGDPATPPPEPEAAADPPEAGE